MALLELATSSLPILLAFFGIIAILLAILGKVEGTLKLDISPTRQILLWIVGLILLVLAVFLLVETGPSPPPLPTDTPILATSQPSGTPAPTSPALTPTPAVTQTRTLTNTPTFVVTPEPQVLFQDDFDHGPDPGWQWDQNFWKVIDGRATNIRCGAISVEANEWNRYILSFDFDLPASTDGNLQVQFAAQEPQNNWAAVLLTEGGNGSVGLLKRKDGKIIWPSGVPSQVSSVFRANEGNHFELRVWDDLVQININGQTAYPEVGLGENLSGRIGLMACPKAVNWVDNLRIVAQTE